RSVAPPASPAPRARVSASGLHPRAVWREELAVASCALRAPAPDGRAQMGQTLTSTPAARVTKLPLVVAAAVMAAISLAAIWQATVVIDHQRYYYLDDDQMISMRYARNLVDGLGLVWNAGDRVEGYTNLGWVFVMAAVHAVGVPERLTSLAVELINIGLAVVILVFTDRLLRRFASPPGWLRFAVLGTLALSIDLIYWAVNGFETTLLTVVFLWA